MQVTVKAIRYGWASRRAWWFTATARSRERFARTTLGSFWLGFSNMLSIGVLATVYGTVFKVPNFNAYVAYLGTGLVIWNTISAAVQSGTNLFRANSANIRNTNIHPIFYSLEEWAFQVQTFLQSFVLVLAALTFFNSALPLNLLTYGLLPLINLLLFIYWAPLIISLLGAKYEDLMQLIPIALQLMFLISPIIYQKDTLGNLSWTANINPIYRILSNLRHAMLNGELKFEQAASILLANIAGTVISVWLLERKRTQLPFWV
jgi:lipopolysaccharide transport system permease protein